MSSSNRSSLPSFAATPSQWLSGLRILIEIRKEAKDSNALDEFEPLNRKLTDEIKKISDEFGLGKGGDYHALLNIEKAIQLKKSVEIPENFQEKLKAAKENLELTSFRRYVALLESEYPKANKLKEAIGKTLSDVYLHFSDKLPEQHKKVAIEPIKKIFDFRVGFEKLATPRSQSPVERKEEVKAEVEVKVGEKKASEDPVLWIRARLKKISEKCSQFKIEKKIVDELSAKINEAEEKAFLKYEKDLSGAKTLKQRPLEYLESLYRNSMAEYEEEKKKGGAGRRLTSLEIHRTPLKALIDAKKEVFLEVLASLEKVYQASYQSLSGRYGGLFSAKFTTPFEFIQLLNNKPEQYHLERMIMMTLKDAYEGYAFLLPEGHQRKVVDDLSYLSLYAFEPPLFGVGVEEAGLRAKKA